MHCTLHQQAFTLFVLAYKYGLLHIAGGGLDLTALCVTSGKICWLLYVDALVLNMDGNVLDALSIAARVGMLTSNPCYRH